MAQTQIGTELIGNGEVQEEDLADGAATGSKLGSDVIVDTGNQTIGGLKTFTTLPQSSATPSSDDDLVTKAYADSIAAGLDPKESCRVTTLLDIGGTYSASGGTGGTGNFTGVDLTSATNFDLSSPAVTLAIGDRILVQNQTDAKQNGIYVVVTAGATGVIERSADMDGSPAGEVSSGAETAIEVGTDNAGKKYILLGDGILTLNTDDLNWTFGGGGGALTAGDGIDITSNVISVEEDVTGGANLATVVDANANGTAIRVDDATIEASTGTAQLAVKDLGITTAKLAGTSVTAAKLGSDVDGNGLTGGNGSALAVESDTTGGANLASAVNVSANGVAIKIDDTTIGENVSNQLELKDGAVSLAKLLAGTGGLEADGEFYYRSGGAVIRAVWVEEQVTTGDFTGTDPNKQYTLTSTPLTGSPFSFFYSGSLLRSGAGNDYTISGNTVTMLFNLPGASRNVTFKYIAAA